MVKRDIKKVLLVLLVLINLGFVSASYELVCLEPGQVLRFSECNPDIDDLVCDHTTCQVCVNEVSTGVYCPASINYCDDICIEIEDPAEPPEIFLVAPGDGYQQNESDEIEFEYDVTLAFLIESCTLIVDDEAVVSSTRRIRLTGNHLDYEVPEGEHTWSIECYPREGFDTYYSDERIIIIGNYTPEPTSVQLVSPGNSQSYTSESISISFQYNVQNHNLVEQCNLILYNVNLNQETVQGNSSAIGSSNSVQMTLTPANYKWKVECAKGSEVLSSSEFSFAVNKPSSGGGGGSSGGGSRGGSGGGGSTTISLSNSTNSSDVIKLTPKPKTETTETEPAVNQTENNEEIVENSFGITGAAVWQDIKENSAVSVLIIGLILIVVIFSYFGYKRK